MIGGDYCISLFVVVGGLVVFWLPLLVMLVFGLEVFGESVFSLLGMKLSILFHWPTLVVVGMCI